MRRIFPFLVSALGLTTAILYACVSDDNTSSPTIDASVPPPPPATTGTPPPVPPPPPPSPIDGGNDSSVPFSPTTLGSRLVLWLDADKGYGVVDGGVVWEDQSDAGNNAHQDTAGQQPDHVDAGGDGGIGARGAIHFDGTKFLSIADATSLQWSASDFLFCAVLRYSNTPASYGIVYAKWTDIYPYPGFFLWADYPYDVAHNAADPWTGYVTRFDATQGRELFTDGGMDDGTARLVSVKRSGNEMKIFVNGTLAGDLPDGGGFDTTGYDAVGIDAVIGGRPALVQMLIGDIGELVAVKGAVTDAEQGQLESYLKSKYGL